MMKEYSSFVGVMEFTRSLQQNPFSELELQVGFHFNILILWEPSFYHKTYLFSNHFTIIMHH